MKTLIVGSISIVLGLAAAHAFAQDVIFRPAGSTSAFQRVAPAGPSAVTLNRPVPISSAADQDLTPAAHLDRPTPVFRAKLLDGDVMPQLMPIGPTPAAAKQQPGTVKPMSQAEQLPMPRAGESPIGPPPTVIYSSPFANGTPGITSMTPDEGVGFRRRRILGQGAWRGEAIGDCGPGVVECGPCEVNCGDCMPDCCGRLGWRLRQWGGCCEDPCCLPRPRMWLRGEALYWGVSDQEFPPLLVGAPGLLPASPVLLGEGTIQQDGRSGGRAQVGFWFPRLCNWGIDASFFTLTDQSYNATISSDAAGNPLLVRPVVNAQTGGVAGQIVSQPGNFAGRFAVDTETQLWGMDANLRRKLRCGPRWWLDGFVGYRHLDLRDAIVMREDITNLNFVAGADTRRFLVTDAFATKNYFDGLQVGMEGELKLFRRWFVGGNFKLAAGNVHQELGINGATLFIDSPQGTVTGVGGLLALVSNIGRYEKNEFAVVSEFGIKLGYDLTDNLRLYAGYNVLFMSNALRAGEQIDPRVNFNAMQPTPTNLVPSIANPARPAVFFRQSEFFAQGGQLGIEYHW